MDIAGTGHAESTLQCCSKICNYVAEHIVCDYHVILIRLENHPHSHCIHKLRVRFDIRIAGCDLGECSLPQIVAIAEHIRFIGHCDALATMLLRILESCDYDPLDTFASI